jgi:hypothetical protein
MIKIFSKRSTEKISILLIKNGFDEIKTMLYNINDNDYQYRNKN